jgi:hypothetical protein
MNFFSAHAHVHEKKSLSLRTGESCSQHMKAFAFSVVEAGTKAKEVSKCLCL